MLEKQIYQATEKGINSINNTSGWEPNGKITTNMS